MSNIYWLSITETVIIRMLHWFVHRATIRAILFHIKEQIDERSQTFCCGNKRQQFFEANEYVQQKKVYMYYSCLNFQKIFCCIRVHWTTVTLSCTSVKTVNIHMVAKNSGCSFKTIVIASKRSSCFSDLRRMTPTALCHRSLYEPVLQASNDSLSLFLKLNLSQSAEYNLFRLDIVGF